MSNFETIISDYSYMDLNQEVLNGNSVYGIGQFLRISLLGQSHGKVHVEPGHVVVRLLSTVACG